MLRLRRTLIASCLVGATVVVVPGTGGTAPPPSTTFSIRTVDSAGTVGDYPSIVLDADGYPVISYYDVTNGNLKVAHCNDEDCAGGNESRQTVDSSADVGRDTSIVLDANGFPVISYFDSDNDDLMVAHCNDANCAGGDESLQRVDSVGIVGTDSSIALDSNGYPVVSYYDLSNNYLKVAHCNDPNCAGGDDSLERPDASGDVGGYTSLVLDSNGYPVVSYYDSANGNLRVAHCNDANCAGANESLRTVDSVGNVGSHTSIALDANGYPVVSYYDATNDNLKVAHCNDANCAGGNESRRTVDDGVDVGNFTSLELDAGGDPVVSYYDNENTTLKLAHCNDPNCAGGNERITSLAPNVYDTTASLALRAGRYAVVAYNQESPRALKVVSQQDTTPPVVKVTGVADGAAYVDGSVPAAGCSTTDVGSGVATNATLSIDAPPSGIGPHSATCDGAVDNAGNEAAPVSVHYTVVFDAANAWYGMVESDGTVYTFPPDRHVGNAALAPDVGETAVDLAINNDGDGYYVLSSLGRVFALGPGSTHRGDLDLSSLQPGETVAAMALTGSGDGYWVFTSRGRAVPFGDATDIGDVSDLPLQAPVVDAAPYPPGFYMTGGDGGVFTPPEFAGSQEVPFYGSVPGVLQPGQSLNEPVVTIYVDASDGDGYSLAAGDGGMFNFNSKFCGSIPGILEPGVTLNQPVVNAVPWGSCYIFFAADGGAFNFSGDELPFLGSLGASPPDTPITSGDAYFG